MSRYCIHANNFFRTCHFKSAAYILLIRSSLYSISLTISSNNSCTLDGEEGVRGSGEISRNSGSELAANPVPGDVTERPSYKRWQKSASRNLDTES